MPRPEPGSKVCTAAAAVAACAALALLVSLAAPSRAEAARTQCAGTFHVLHNDRIGQLRLPQGRYRITILASGRPSCAQASRLFALFLQDYDGNLPGGWRVLAGSSTFLRARGVGFHVRRAGRGGTGGGGEAEEEAGGGGRHPAGGRFCPGTFRVLHDDRIGPLRLRRGPYWIILLQRRGLACAQASRLLARFLEDFRGNLPHPWRLEAQSASFRRGGPRAIGFRVKPAR